MPPAPPAPSSFRRTLGLLVVAVPLFRPGSDMPGAHAPFAGGPDPLTSHVRRRPTGRLRSSLRASLVEGILAEVVTACAGGAMLTGWALYLGASPVQIGLLGSLPFASQFLQLPSAWLSCLAGYRKVAVLAVTASRQVLWPLVVLPFLPLGIEQKRQVLLGVAALAALLGVIGNNAWVAWMGELVPRQLRGRYFGRRTALCTLGGTIASLAGGVWVDAAQARGHGGEALSLLAIVAVFSGLATMFLLKRQHTVTAAGGRGRFELSAALAPLRDPRARRLVTYQVVWNLAIGVSSAFFAVHMLQNLGMGFARMAAYNAALATVRVVTGPLWGRAIDRVGPRTVLVACSFGVCIVPLIWLLPQPGSLWPLLIEICVSGVLWSGHGLAAFALPLAHSPRTNRPFYLATFSTAGGLAFAAAAAFGGFVVAALPGHLEALGHLWYGTHAVFLLSMIGRVTGACLALRIHDDRGRGVQALFTLMRTESPLRVLRGPSPSPSAAGAPVPAMSRARTRRPAA